HVGQLVRRPVLFGRDVTRVLFRQGYHFFQGGKRQGKSLVVEYLHDEQRNAPVSPDPVSQGFDVFLLDREAQPDGCLLHLPEARLDLDGCFRLRDVPPATLVVEVLHVRVPRFVSRLPPDELSWDGQEVWPLPPPARSGGPRL